MAEDTRTVALPNITAADFSIDAQGQVVVRNPALAERIKSSAELRPDLAEAAGNGICCGNTGCLSEQLVGLFETLVARTRPR